MACCAPIETKEEPTEEQQTFLSMTPQDSICSTQIERDDDTANRVTASLLLGASESDHHRNTTLGWNIGCSDRVPEPEGALQMDIEHSLHTRGIFEDAEPVQPASTNETQAQEQPRSSDGVMHAEEQNQRLALSELKGHLCARELGVSTLSGPKL